MARQAPAADRALKLSGHRVTVKCALIGSVDISRCSEHPVFEWKQLSWFASNHDSIYRKIASCCQGGISCQVGSSPCAPAIGRGVVTRPPTCRVGTGRRLAGLESRRILDTFERTISLQDRVGQMLNRQLKAYRELQAARQ